MNEFTVDSKEVLRVFAELSSKKQKLVHKTALRKAANVLVKETRALLRGSLNNPKSLMKGVKSKVNSSGEAATVHIMGDYRLKFFELGTKLRFAKKRNGKPLKKLANRGTIGAIHFFRTALNNKEKEIFSNMDNFISESIKKVAKV